MDPGFEPSGINEDGEISAGVHQVQVGGVSHPGVWTGQGQLQVEVDLEVVGHVVAVQENGFNLKRKQITQVRQVRQVKTSKTSQTSEDK